MTINNDIVLAGSLNIRQELNAVFGTCKLSFEQVKHILQINNIKFTTISQSHYRNEVVGLFEKNDGVMREQVSLELRRVLERQQENSFETPEVLHFQENDKFVTLVFENEPICCLKELIEITVEPQSPKAFFEFDEIFEAKIFEIETNRNFRVLNFLQKDFNIGLDGEYEINQQVDVDHEFCDFLFGDIILSFDKKRDFVFTHENQNGELEHFFAKAIDYCEENGEVEKREDFDLLEAFNEIE